MQKKYDDCIITGCLLLAIFVVGFFLGGNH